MDSVFVGRELQGTATSRMQVRKCRRAQPQLGHLCTPPGPELQFSFDGDRHLTPWLTIIGKHAPVPPFVEVELVRTGNTIKSGGCPQQRPGRASTHHDRQATGHRSLAVPHSCTGFCKHAKLHAPRGPAV